MEKVDVFLITIEDDSVKLQPSPASIQKLEQEKEDLSIAIPQPDLGQTDTDVEDLERRDNSDNVEVIEGDPDPLLASIISSSRTDDDPDTLLHQEIPVPLGLEHGTQDTSLILDDATTVRGQDTSLILDDATTVRGQDTSLILDNVTTMRGQDTSLTLMTSPVGHKSTTTGEDIEREETSQSVEYMTAGFSHDTSPVLGVKHHYSHGLLSPEDVGYLAGHETLCSQRGPPRWRPDTSKYMKKPGLKPGSAPRSHLDPVLKHPPKSRRDRLVTSDRVKLISRHYDTCPLRSVPLQDKERPPDRVELISQHYDTCGLKHIPTSHTHSPDYSNPATYGTRARWEEPRRLTSLQTDRGQYGATRQYGKIAKKDLHVPVKTDFKYISERSYDCPLVADMDVLEDILRQCREILDKYGKTHRKQESPELSACTHRAIDYHRRALAREHVKLDDVEDLLHECRHILAKTGIPVPDVKPTPLHSNLFLPSKRDKTCTPSEFRDVIERDTRHMTTRELIQYLYTTYPPNIVLTAPYGLMLGHTDLTKSLQEAIITYNPLWQKRYDHSWRQQCIHIRDVLIGRQRGLLVESGLESKQRMRASHQAERSLTT